jgi:peroxiredoxin
MFINHQLDVAHSRGNLSTELIRISHHLPDFIRRFVNEHGTGDKLSFTSAFYAHNNFASTQTLLRFKSRINASRVEGWGKR